MKSCETYMALMDAADRLEEPDKLLGGQSWCQRNNANTLETKFCINGALNLIIGGHAYSYAHGMTHQGYRVKEQANEIINNLLDLKSKDCPPGSDYTWWNDHVCQSAQEAATLLRRAALQCA